MIADRRSIRLSRGDRVYSAVNHLFLAFALLIVLYPLVYIISSSFSDAQEVLTGRVWLLPINPNLDGYKAVFEYKDVWLGYGNSIFYTVFGTIYNVAMTMIVAYPLARKDFIGRGPIMFLFTFTMFFHGGLIPTYLLIKSLGMIDTRAVLIVPGAIIVWYLIITRTYLQSTIPGELYEAARVDGATNSRMLWSVVLPLSGPIIAVITLFYAVNHWNQFFNALVYIRRQELRPLQIILREILVLNSPGVIDQLMASASPEQVEALQARMYLQGLIQFALIVVATAPILAVYPFVQKYFVRGVMIGALKG
jgi:multiple sugar transport system permease protein/putative aldouronate transport system permease protein